MKPTYEQLEEVANLALGALQWCSGSQDFAPEGQARVGWEKLCQPLIGRLNKYFCDLPAVSVHEAVDEVVAAAEWSSSDESDADDDADDACAKTIIGEVIGDNQSMMARLRVVEHPGSIFASLQIGSLGGDSVYLSYSELIDLYDFLDEHRVLLEEDEELEDLPPDREGECE